MTSKIIAEYVWIGGDGELRSKARTLSLNNNDTLKLHDHLPEWNYDGSSTKQASGKDSEVLIKPHAVYKCPFRRGNNILVMCDIYQPNGTPLKGNNRYFAKKLFDKNLDSKPWYGIEQEFFMFSNTTEKPMGFPANGNPNPQGQYYCGVGSHNAFCRDVIDMHYDYCLYAGLNISGINAEVAPGQWEYQIGPVEGIDAGDQLYISRYILQRISEKFNVSINIEPKPIVGDWNGSGCHTNYSTKQMREGTDEKTGLDYINDAVDKLSLKHDEHMAVYGSGNEMRMTGKHETACFDKFTSGVANRAACIRIPNTTMDSKKGYLEDRRPSSNMDPYLVTGIIFKTTVLDT